MRSLLEHGWLNFRMRAMLVSFACYNLWLDWRRIAGHLARCFLDYEVWSATSSFTRTFFVRVCASGVEDLSCNRCHNVQTAQGRAVSGRSRQTFAISLDLQPGIHYPQLQMQAGTTGINAMRVYSVTKQGLDQDKKGKFIKRYVPELKNVPLKWLHEPWKMPCAVQRECGVVIGQDGSYPKPIVDEKASAKTAKDRVSAVKKQGSTRQQAQQVFVKHG